jgi:hypothetical protein
MPVNSRGFRICLPPLTLLAFASLGAPSARAQCTNQWLPGEGIAGVHGGVSASTMWDPDGAGPAPVRLVIAGAFDLVGTQPIHNIAQWDPVTGTWSALGTGLEPIRALAVMPNGTLVAAGNNVSSWNGSSWTSFGYTPSGVHALAVMPNGDLVAGGYFTMFNGSIPAVGVARWDGTAWSSLGSGTSI